MNDQCNPLRILLAYDGSQHALASLAFLRDLPLPDETRVHIVAVLPPREASNHHIMEAALDQANSMLVDRAFQVSTDMLVGSPPEKVIEFADQEKPDLIVVGAQGLRATLGILLGGTAQQVVEYATWPVLVIRAPYKGLREILIVTDGSPYSQRAVDFLGCFPLPEKVKIRVMHVLPPLFSSAMLAQTLTVYPELVAKMPSYESEVLASKQAEEEECEGKALLARTLKQLKASGLNADSVLVRGDAATEVIQYVKDHPISLVVAGSRGLSSVRGWLLGSVSRKLVHYAGCSVMVVKG